MGWSTLLRAADGAVLGIVVGWLLWGPLVYRAMWNAAERAGVANSMPRHRPGWPRLAAICAVAGAAADVGLGSHLAAIPAAVASTLAVAAYHDLPGRLAGQRARRAALQRLRRELAETDAGQ